MKTFEEYEKEVFRTHDNGHTDTDLGLVWNAMGLAGESGEVVDAIKKLVFHGKDIPKEQIARELGDVLWYLTALSRCLGFTLEDVCRMNKDKLRARFPNGWSKDDANARRDEG